jgi:Protein of unknown function (DUF1573)
MILPENGISKAGYVLRWRASVPRGTSYSGQMWNWRSCMASQVADASIDLRDCDVGEEGASMGATQAVRLKWEFSWIASTAVLTGILLSSLMGAALWHFGSIGAALAYTRGERLFAKMESIGTMTRGEERKAELVISNLGDKPVRILGAASSCSCVATSGVPTTIPAKDMRIIPVKLRAGNLIGRSVQRLRIFTDHPRQRDVEALVMIEVVVETATTRASASRSGKGE